LKLLYKCLDKELKITTSKEILLPLNQQ